MRSNTRRAGRTQFHGEVILSWDDRSGSAHYANAKCVDISKTGLSLNLREPIPARSYVSFRVDKYNLAGRAAVKHCAKRGAHFLIGIEFAGGLKFDPPSSN